MLGQTEREYWRKLGKKGYILACKVFCEMSLVKAPMPLLEMAAKEKWYSVFGRRPSTTYEDVGPNVLTICHSRKKQVTLKYIQP